MFMNFDIGQIAVFLGLAAFGGAVAQKLGTSVIKLIKKNLMDETEKIIKDPDFKVWFLNGVLLAQKKIGAGAGAQKKAMVKKMILDKVPNMFDDFADRVFEAAWTELVLPIK